jgi:hypothetical protein
MLIRESTLRRLIREALIGGKMDLDLVADSFWAAFNDTATPGEWRAAWRGGLATPTAKLGDGSLPVYATLLGIAMYSDKVGYNIMSYLDAAGVPSPMEDDGSIPGGWSFLNVTKRYAPDARMRVVEAIQKVLGVTPTGNWDAATVSALRNSLSREDVNEILKLTQKSGFVDPFSEPDDTDLYAAAEKIAKRAGVKSAYGEPNAPLAQTKKSAPKGVDVGDVGQF